MAMMFRMTRAVAKAKVERAMIEVRVAFATAESLANTGAAEMAKDRAQLKAVLAKLLYNNYAPLFAPAIAPKVKAAPRVAKPKQKFTYTLPLVWKCKQTKAKSRHHLVKRAHRSYLIGHGITW